GTLSIIFFILVYIYSCTSFLDKSRTYWFLPNDLFLPGIPITHSGCSSNNLLSGDTISGSNQIPKSSPIFFIFFAKFDKPLGNLSLLTYQSPNELEISFLSPNHP